MHEAWRSIVDWVLLPGLQLADRNLAWLQSLQPPWQAIAAGLEFWILLMILMTACFFTWRGIKGIRSFFFTLFTGLTPSDLVARIVTLEKKISTSGESTVDLSGMEERLSDITGRLESLEEAEGEEDENLPSARQVKGAIDDLLEYLNDSDSDPAEFRTELGQAFGVLARYVIATKNPILVDALAKTLAGRLAEVPNDELVTATAAERAAVLKEVGRNVFNAYDPAFQSRVEASAKELVSSWGKALPALDEAAMRGLASTFVFDQIRQILNSPPQALTDRVLSDLFLPWLGKVINANDLAIGLQTSNELESYMRERLARIRDSVVNNKALSPRQARIVEFMDDEIIARLRANGNGKSTSVGGSSSSGIHPAGHTS